MKRPRVLLLLALILAVVIGAFLFLKYGPLLEESTSPEISGIERREIAKFDKALLKTMKVTTKDYTLNLYKENDQWKVEGTDVRLDSTSVDELAHSFASLYAESLVEENPEDLVQYGLNPPLSIAGAMLTDGTAYKFYLGNKTAAGNTYYLMAKDDPKVYAVWMNHGLHFQYRLDDIRDRKLPAINFEEFTNLKLIRHGHTVMEVVKIDDPPDDVEFSTTSLFMTAPYDPPEPISMDRWPDFQGAIPSFTIEKFVDDNPADLSQYGLEKASAELILADTEKMLHLICGATRDGMTYFLKAGESSVYAMEAGKLEFLAVKPFSLIDKFAFIVNIDHVDKIRIKAPGRDYSLSISRKEEDEISYFLNEGQVEEKPFKTLYQSLIALYIDAEHRKELSEKAEVTLHYSLNKGKNREHRISFVPYDVDFYALFKNGKSGFLVSRNQIQNMLEALDKFALENRS